jgi:hypothetical protein
VLVLPGLVASDTSTRPLRSFLKGHGHAVSGWRQGRNLGLRDGVQHAMLIWCRSSATNTAARALDYRVATRRSFFLAILIVIHWDSYA